MIGSERLSQLLEDTPGRPGQSARSSSRRCGWRARSWARPGPRPRDPARRPRGLARARAASTSPASTRSTTACSTLGLRPVVELSFMPRGLAADPSATVFEYGAGISVPSDWDALGGARARAHRPPGRPLRDRRGRALGLRGLERGQPRGVLDRHRRRSTSGSTSVAVRAVKDVDERLLVGGPATAAAGWITRLPGLRGRHAAPRSTSSPPTPTGTCRSTSARRCASAGSTASRSGGPSGA